MAGIYLHIPFCKTRCIYCDFYSTTHSELKQRYIDALCTELRMRRNYLQGEPIHTIYFGGGTPSQLNVDDFQQIFQTLKEVYDLEECKEITLEANPDDLTDDYTEQLCTLPFNRISMGIQTFDDSTLKLLNRRHNAAQAIQAIKNCRQAGFQNISIDLIYGLPGETDTRWEADLDQAISLGVEHISAYHLIYEEGTPLYKLLHQHRVKEIDEDSSLRFFITLIDRLKTAGYQHYEISNFCKPGYHSKHNSSYWEGIPYLGCGPSAHSFNTYTRDWNAASLTEYLQGMEKGERPYEIEELDLNTRYNETIMTSLRTSRGIHLPKLQQTFGNKLYQYCMQMATPYIKAGKIIQKGDFLRFTRDGIFVSDGIMAELMYINE